MFRWIPLMEKTSLSLLKYSKNNKMVRPLGRWGLNDGNADLRALQACIDSCGDTLCGDPNVYRQEKLKTKPSTVQKK